MTDKPIVAVPGYIDLEEVQPKTQISSPKLSEARNRLPANVLSNVAWLMLNLLVRMWYTPFLIGHLGVAVYGLIPLIGAVTEYMAIFTEGFNTAADRLLMIDLAKRDAHGANRTFNTSVVFSIITTAVLLPLALLLAWFTPRIFDIPVGYERDAQILVLLTTSAFTVTAFASCVAISSYAYHRFDLRFLVNVVRLLANTGIVVGLFLFFSPKLWQVGVGTFLSSFFFLIGHTILWRKLTPELFVKFKLFDWARLKQMLSLSGWILVNHIGSLLFLSIDLIVANYVFGAEVAGRYGAVIIFPALLRTLVGTVSGVFVPIVMTLYAQNDFTKLVRFFNVSIKFLGLVMALPIGLLCGLAKPILTTWLGPEFSDLSWLVIVLIGHVCINNVVVPLFSLQVAADKVRLPGIVTLIMGVMNVVLAVAFALWSGWGYIGIAAAGAIVLTAKNTLFTPLYGARILKLPWYTFLPNLLTGAVACLMVGLVSYGVSLNWDVAGWGALALVTVIIAGIYVVVAYFLGLNAADRELLKFEIQRRLK